MAEYYSNISLFVVTGKSLVYSVVESMFTYLYLFIELPEGLIINSLTGLISGKTNNLVKSTPIKFIISNSYSSTYVNVNIGVIEPDYPIAVHVEDSITIFPGIVLKNYKFFDVIGPNINYRLIPDGIYLFIYI